MPTSSHMMQYNSAAIQCGHAQCKIIPVIARELATVGPKGIPLGAIRILVFTLTAFSAVNRFRCLRRVSFLRRQERYERTGSGGGAGREIYPTAWVVAPLYPDFEPPSPEIPSRPLRGSLELRDRFLE